MIRCRGRGRFARAAHFTSVLLLSASLAGCSISPLAKRTAAFSTAAASTINRTENVYQLVNRTHHEAQVDLLVVTFDQNGFHPETIKPFLPEEDLEVRTKVLNGLRAYATALAEVSGDKPIAEFDTKAKAAGQALTGLTKDDLKVLKVDSTETSIAATALDALGHVLIERERRKALPAILTKMDKPIQDICTLLESDLGTRGSPGLASALDRDYASQMRAQQKYIRDNEAHMSPDERRRNIELLPRLATAQQRSDRLLETAVKSLRSLADAHSALAASASQKDSPAFRIKLSELVDNAQTLAGFYGTLSTSSTSSQ